MKTASHVAIPRRHRMGWNKPLPIARNGDQVAMNDDRNTRRLCMESARAYKAKGLPGFWVKAEVEAAFRAHDRIMFWLSRGLA